MSGDKMVSIILCTYNRENSIRYSIDSILEQTYQNWELIIVDDGSTDGTEKILEEYQDHRIRKIVLSDNSYYCYAANKGIREASGKYIAFATSDDIWEKTKLEKQIAYLEAHPECGAVFSHVFLIDAEGVRNDEQYPEMVSLFQKENRTRDKWLRELFENGNQLSHPSAIVRKSILDEIGGYNLLFAQVADMDLWIRILQKTEIYVFQEQLVGYRWWSAKGQISGVTEEKQMRVYHEIAILQRQMIEEMKDDVFLRGFHDHFRNPDSQTHNEIRLEKMFFLLDMGNKYPGLTIQGLEMAEMLMREDGMADLMKEHFGIKLQELYKINGKPWYAGPMEVKTVMEHEKKIDLLEAEIRKMKALQDESKKELQEILTSKSWKITMPLRFVMNTIRRK